MRLLNLFKKGKTPKAVPQRRSPLTREVKREKIQAKVTANMRSLQSTRTMIKNYHDALDVDDVSKIVVELKSMVSDIVNVWTHEHTRANEKPFKLGE